MDQTTQQPNLLTPVQLGPYELRNRMVMAPMTRNRAGEGNVPTSLTATYYAQRASAGLLITEGTQVSPEGVGYPRTPGIHTDAQVEGWRRVTDAVHARGGRIFAQLWHVGRVSHPLLQPDGALPVAPSAIAPAGMAYTENGRQPYVAPRALEIHEIPGVVRQFEEGSRRALESGFDGVELHGANGYLIDQFLRDGTNRRTDAYGGPVQNRARFLLEVTEAVTGVWGAERVGIRFSPTHSYNDMSDSDPAATFSYVAEALNWFGPAYIHVIEPLGTTPPVARLMRERSRSRFILNGSYTLETGNAALASRAADLVSFGTLFLANPDLPERFAEGAPLNTPDPATFYFGTEKGYTDYPTRHAVAAATV
ncbi:MAG TPA: alkene reductase [Thermoanaerobaculia bacterium]|nr:alkene reductase [Thermoanaerobaculia bacterium]